MNESHFNVDTIAFYLNHLKKEISPIKLQKSLYFLFAYHGATYGHELGEGVSEGSNISTKQLFDAKFEAWKFGPVIREVYVKDKRGEYTDVAGIRDAVEQVSAEHEIKNFIDDLFGQIDSVSDFQLVERSHQDNAWKNAYQVAQSTEIDNEFLITEYKTRYVADVD
ncbi:DUF4065 domain-containing protein [Paenibacillus sp. CFBP 13594]|uniref:Panacea domain-containing protein n=1 Tax=Paenibacillus sp. CFBP 13594 TaxID=2774037 RepID=UPI001781A0C8|nr:type II toxin-antitoxin system antitoxin SocA domain-containing protein [Paenibacillus sp. CFBP 13594]MBD8839503.1 DUF4065 domain-containing protein [Paenibacillus sp. CFBP 13594]